jgi:predicted DCC family thiol-disulfide oxidoreductase YuxK
MSASTESPVPQLTVYFDGLCRLCSREIEHYQKRDRNGVVRWVDITGADFSAESEGLDPVAIHKVMHVRDSAGAIHTEVAAFVAIWKVIPGFRPLAHVAGWKPVRPVLDLGYQVFARIRPYLPKKKREECTDGRCPV